MEAESRRRSSKRKPLSDCTNILPQPPRKNPSKFPQSQTLIKPPKPTNNNSINNKINPNLNLNLPTNNNNNGSSPISHTSTGSNASPTSLPHPPHIGGKKSGILTDRSQRQHATRKDKGKMVADPSIMQLAAFLTPKPLRISSSPAAPDHQSRSGVQVDQSQRLNAQTINDKGKGVVDASVTAPYRSKYLRSSSSATNDSLVETSAVHNQKQHEETTKDSGKTILETPNTEAFLTSNSPQIPSSASPGHSSQSGVLAVHAQKNQDKGKGIADDPVLQLAAPYVSKYLQSSSPVTSGSLSETSASHSRKLHEETRKDKGKMVLETPNTEAYEPSTPDAPHVSYSVATSGTSEKPVTVYGQRRSQRGRKHEAGKINVSLSCPPGQRMKKTGLGLLDYDQGDGKSGSHTDPRPVHKKKRSHSKDGGSMHVMPQEEVEKLRAYYADIDAFELPEEVVSEDELE